MNCLLTTMVLYC